MAAWDGVEPLRCRHHAATTRLALTGSVIYAGPGQPGYRHTDLDSAQSSGDPFSLLTGSTECPVDSELRTDAHSGWCTVNWPVRQRGRGLAVESAHRWVSSKRISFINAVSKETLVHVVGSGLLAISGRRLQSYFGRQPLSYSAGRLWQP